MTFSIIKYEKIGVMFHFELAIFWWLLYHENQEIDDTFFFSGAAGAKLIRSLVLVLHILCSVPWPAKIFYRIFFSGERQCFCDVIASPPPSFSKIKVTFLEEIKVPDEKNQISPLLDTFSFAFFFFVILVSGRLSRVPLPAQPHEIAKKVIFFQFLTHFFAHIHILKSNMIIEKSTAWKSLITTILDIFEIVPVFAKWNFHT